MLQNITQANFNKLELPKINPLKRHKPQKSLDCIPVKGSQSPKQVITNTVFCRKTFYNYQSIHKVSDYETKSTSMKNISVDNSANQLISSFKQKLKQMTNKKIANKLSLIKKRDPRYFKNPASHISLSQPQIQKESFKRRIIELISNLKSYKQEDGNFENVRLVQMKKEYDFISQDFNDYYYGEILIIFEIASCYLLVSMMEELNEFFKEAIRPRKNSTTSFDLFVMDRQSVLSDQNEIIPFEQDCKELQTVEETELKKVAELVEEEKKEEEKVEVLQVEIREEPKQLNMQVKQPEQKRQSTKKVRTHFKSTTQIQTPITSKVQIRSKKTNNSTPISQFPEQGPQQQLNEPELETEKEIEKQKSESDSEEDVNGSEMSPQQSLSQKTIRKSVMQPIVTQLIQNQISSSNIESSSQRMQLNENSILPSNQLIGPQEKKRAIKTRSSIEYDLSPQNNLDETISKLEDISEKDSVDSEKVKEEKESPPELPAEIVPKRGTKISLGPDFSSMQFGGLNGLKMPEKSSSKAPQQQVRQLQSNDSNGSNVLRGESVNLIDLLLHSKNIYKVGIDEFRIKSTASNWIDDIESISNNEGIYMMTIIK